MVIALVVASADEGENCSTLYRNDDDEGEEIRGFTIFPRPFVARLLSRASALPFRSAPAPWESPEKWVIPRKRVEKGTRSSASIYGRGQARSQPLEKTLFS